MARKFLKTYYQGVCYTTDHCDGDLIAPCCWEPTSDRKVAAKQIMDEIEASFAHIISKNLGPNAITFEFRYSTADNIDWAPAKTIKNWKRSQAFRDTVAEGLADGTISTVMVTVPEYVNWRNVLIEKRSDVFHINTFQL